MGQLLNNSEKYHFADFTLQKFKEYIRLAKQNYKFRDYDNFKKDEKYIIWRHDLDYSIHAAVKLAKIEAEEGIKATYFLLPHSKFYNLLELDVCKCVKEILDAGHKLGLHFDTDFYKERDPDFELEVCLKLEKELLENFFGDKIAVFSFHNPGQMGLDLNKDEFAGMMNAYSTYFRNEAGYCSDSFGIWRYERLEDVLRNGEHKRLQILTHPEWWSEKVTSPAERIRHCIQGRAENNWNSFENILKVYGLDIIDWK